MWNFTKGIYPHWLPNYYQINIFVDTLSCQLKRFTTNFTLSSGNLIQNGNFLNRPNLKYIRVKLMKVFIINASHFAIGVFKKLSFTQMENYKIRV